jgi:hypothetical protein
MRGCECGHAAVIPAQVMQKAKRCVIPAQAGIHPILNDKRRMDSRLRGNDGQERAAHRHS